MQIQVILSIDLLSEIKITNNDKINLSGNTINNITFKKINLTLNVLNLSSLWRFLIHLGTC